MDTNTIITLDIRSHFAVEMSFNSDTVNVNSHARFAIQTPGGTDYPLTISGSTADSATMLVESDSGSCELDIDYAQTINSIVLDSLAMDEDECPQSGNIALTFNFDLACVGTDEYNLLNIDGGWTATFTFANDMVNGRYENPTTYWTFSEQCRGYGAVAKRWARPYKL